MEFAVIRGQQRNTTFYQANIPFGDIARNVDLPEEVLGDDLFDKQNSMQRKLNWKRVRDEMVPYLKNPDAFYSSISLFIIPRDFNEVEEEKGYEFKPSTGLGSDLGTLEIDSSMILFPADGQHRVGSIKEILNPKNADYDPDVANVTFAGDFDPLQVKEQVRQFFADLNQNAKNVNKSMGISFGTRDPIARIVKSLENSVPLFVQNIHHFSTSLSQKDPRVITINTAYECTNILAQAMKIDTDNLWSIPDDDNDFKLAAKKITEAWRVITDALPGWKEYLEDEMSSGQVRELYVHAHSVGWRGVCTATSVIIEEKGELGWDHNFRDLVARINWKRENQEWQSVCMIGDRMNNTSTFVKTMAGYLLSKLDLLSGRAGPLVKNYEDVRRRAALR